MTGATVAFAAGSTLSFSFLDFLGGGGGASSSELLEDEDASSSSDSVSSDDEPGDGAVTGAAATATGALSGYIQMCESTLSAEKLNILF